MAENNQGVLPDDGGDSTIQIPAVPKEATTPEELVSNVNPEVEVSSSTDSSVTNTKEEATSSSTDANDKSEKVEAVSTIPDAQPNEKESNEISKLELEIQKRTRERDNYQKKLTETERRLVALQTSYDAVTKGGGDEISLRREVEDLKNNLTQARSVLDDRGRLVANQETQINALTKQVTSLKEVVAITKDLLNIRNMEVQHLQNDVDTMENKIYLERERHRSMINKMDAAARLNADLKKEYETQLRLFQDLRGKYEQKVTLLTEENHALGAAAQSTV